MYRKYIVLFFSLSIIIAAKGQRANQRIKFQANAGAGLIAGHTEPSGQWQLVNGFKSGNWFGGIGAGMDFYRYRTVPLFLSVRRENLFHRPFFVFSDGGLSIPAVTDDQKQGIVEDNKFYTGIYSETGIGYRAAAGRNLAFLFSAGYSFRTLREHAEVPELWRSSWPADPQIVEYRYKFHVLTLKVAVSLGKQ